jgi:hypothetical protein
VPSRDWRWTFALLLDDGELALEQRDAVAREPAVGLELRSPGPRVPMPPPSRSRCCHMWRRPRQAVLELRDLDLEPRLARARVRAKMRG